MNTPKITHLKERDSVTVKRMSVSLSEDVVEALERVVTNGEFDNYSQAIRRAVRIAFINGKAGGADD